VPYHISDKVWLKGKNISTLTPSLKLAPQRYSPFPILSAVNDVTFHLDLPIGWQARLHPVFHASLLSPYRETTAHGPNFTQPSPDLVDGDEHYEIESIINSHFIRSTLHYLVHWLRYPSSDDQWLPASELSHAPDLITLFHTSHPSAPSPTSTSATSQRHGCRH